jgi:hypothetical protein
MLLTNLYRAIEVLEPREHSRGWEHKVGKHISQRWTD